MHKFPRSAFLYVLKMYTRGAVPFPGGSVVKDLPADAGDVGLIPGLGEGPLEKGLATHSSIPA